MASKMLLVDGNSLMHRAFHALPVMTSESGDYTNALHGFLMMLLRVIADEKPDLCAVAFDLHAPTFRHIKYDAYKAGRAPTPDELRAQFGTIHDILNEMHIRIVELEGYEADDLLGTLSLKCEEQGIDCLIITGDRDAFQLSGPRTTILYTKQGIKDTERVTPDFIRGQWNLAPAQLIDMKGLMGDTSDNIPGVSGVGEKTAQKLIEKYGTLENVLDRAEADQKGKLRERLMDGRDSALFSKWLATIDRHAPLPVEPADCPIHALRDGAQILNRLQLRQVVSRLDALGEAEELKAAIHLPAAEACEVLPAAALTARLKSAGSAVIAVSVGAYLCVATDAGLNAAVRLGGDLIDPGLGEADALAMIAPCLNKARLVIVHDLKRLLSLGFSCGAPVFDAMLAGYVINSQRRSFSLTALCADQQIPLNDDFPAPALLRLYAQQQAALQKDNLEGLLQDVEMPLSRVLFGMERAGVLTDRDALLALSDEFNAQIDALLGDIHKEAGEDLNVNSPKQLGALLFDKMRLPERRKRRKQAGQPAPTCWKISRTTARWWPKFSNTASTHKLKSTYVDALLQVCAARTDASTPRSTRRPPPRAASAPLEPNLQNIPVRTRAGTRDPRARSSPRRAACWWTRTIRRSSCACWRTCPATRRCVAAFLERRGHPHAAPPPRSTACRSRW